jgi:hypothetical protein
MEEEGFKKVMAEWKAGIRYDRNDPLGKKTQ